MTPSRLSAAVLSAGTALAVAAVAAAPAFADGHGKPNGDPAGNNGTIKVDGVPFDDSHGNEPHVTCDFRVAFWGFDEGQRGDLTITGQAPSGSGVVSNRTDLLISDDAAGGGNDPDATVVYGQDDLDLSGLEAHPKQGYHVKITFSTDTPGGVKHKVIWLQPCATPTQSPTPEVSATVSESASPTPEVSASVTESASPTPEVSASVTESGSPAPTVTPAVLGKKFTKPGANVLGTKLTRPSGLAFTGSYAALLAVVGGLAVAIGGAVLALARRRRLT